jgi:uncharacterized OB-fold protein
MSADVPRPLPRMAGLTQAFYDWCAKNELRFQRCADCATWRYVPREMCAHCGSFAWRWERSSGYGRVFTWTTVERPMHPAFAGDAPYLVVVVEMDEGVRLASNVIGCAPGEMKIGMPVEVAFQQAQDGVVLPVFRRKPATKAAAGSAAQRRTRG